MTHINDLKLIYEVKSIHESLPTALVLKLVSRFNIKFQDSKKFKIFEDIILEFFIRNSKNFQC